ncbi:uncharacterized protein LOC112053600 [Bicyclus anynana]|uniref:Uncharacterized protein LOC112053600 n=1 Tax=Bicyclus anynana TaxID=110368 RepID=A0A6J1NM62_BICAN|nr:uncharacterized protein LOC112053600 [Bicyclus anynana]XP_023948830.2 uncharacterized protein LOC112053600 [Bicyclus anynana]
MAAEDFKSLLQVSPALTNELLSEALTEWFKEPVTFTHWEYVGDTGKGDSYLSEVIRIKIYGDANDTSKYVQVVLKNIPKNVCRRLTYRSDEFFKNEINFYLKVVPKLLEFQATKNVADPFKGFTKLFLAYSDGLNDVVCLEDANIEGFGTHKLRQEGIDYEHCKVTIKSLAQFHALSFALRDQNPELLNRISDALFETYYDPRLWDWYERFWKRVCGIAIDAVEKEFPNSVYLEKVKEFSVPERYEDMIRAVRDKTNAVISHGDSWTNNFLFKYEGDTPVGAKIIDFQLSRCASPVLDIVFFIYACTDQVLREKYYDELLKYYHEVLSTQISGLGSDPLKVYPWETFMAEVKKYSYFGLAFSFESTPFIILAPEDAVSMDMEGDKKKNIEDFWQIPPIRTKEGRLREANNIVHCVDRGYI